MFSSFADKMKDPTKISAFSWFRQNEIRGETIGITFKSISLFEDEFCQVPTKYRYFSWKMFSLFADKMKEPTTVSAFFTMPRKWNSQENIGILFAKLFVHSTTWMLSGPDTISAFSQAKYFLHSLYPTFCCKTGSRMLEEDFLTRTGVAYLFQQK